MIFAGNVRKNAKESPVMDVFRVPPGEQVALEFEHPDGARVYIVQESDFQKIMEARMTLKALELFLRLGGHEDEADQVASVFKSFE